MFSSRKNRSQLWLGPAAFVNHDCQPNCEFTINCDGDARMSLEARVDIKKGDEIFIFYGKHFFDANNASCECFTCELLGQGYFSQAFIECDKTATVPNGRQNIPTTTPDENTEKNGIKLVTEDEIEETLRQRLIQIPNSRRISTGGKIFSEVQLMSLENPSLPPTAAVMNGILAKGISVGLAQKGTPQNYSLRHTGSRLNRVKAKIYSEMARAFLARAKPAHAKPSRRSLGGGPCAAKVRASCPSFSTTSVKPTRPKKATRTDASRTHPPAPAPPPTRYSLRSQTATSSSPAADKADTASATAAQIPPPPAATNPPFGGQRRKFPPPRPPPPLVDEFIDLVDEEDDDAPGDQSSDRQTVVAVAPRPDSTPPPDLDQMEEGADGARSPTAADDDHLSEVAQLSYMPACLSTPNIHSSTVSGSETPKTSACTAGSVASSLCDYSRELWTCDSTDSTRTLTVIATEAAGLSTAASAPTTVSQSRASARVRSRRRRLTNYDAKLIASVAAPAAPMNTYFLRTRKSKELPAAAAAADSSPPRSPLPHQPACFYLDSPTSTSSSATCPAVDPECVVPAPPRDRLVLVCKRSHTGSTDLSSPLSHVSSEVEWFVEHSPPPLLHVSSLYRPMSAAVESNKRRHNSGRHQHNHHLRKRGRTLLPPTTVFDPQSPSRCLTSCSRSSSRSRAVEEGGTSPLICDLAQTAAGRRTASLTGLPRNSSQSSCLTCYSLASPSSVCNEEEDQASDGTTTVAAAQFGNSRSFLQSADDCPPVRASSSLRCPTPVVLCPPTHRRHNFSSPRSSVVFGASYSPAAASSAAAHKTFLLRSQLARQSRSMWTTGSSLINTPSPPHLQPALTPPPPLLQEPDYFPPCDAGGGLSASSSSSPITMAPECSSCPPLFPDAPDSPLSINPGLEQNQGGSKPDLHRICLNGSTASSGRASPTDGLQIKPLTVTIKRMGQKLYCVSGFETEESAVAVEQGEETSFLGPPMH